MEDCIDVFGCFIPESLFFPALIVAVVIGFMFVAFLAKVVKTARTVSYDPYSR